MTATHPSIYDDFDAIMAAAHLLSADGAGYALDGAAWIAAYDYYGHDADRRDLRRPGARARDRLVPARLLHQLRRRDGDSIEAVHAAYGAPVLAALTQPAPPRARQRHGPCEPTSRRRCAARRRPAGRQSRPAQAASPGRSARRRPGRSRRRCRRAAAARAARGGSTAVRRAPRWRRCRRARRSSCARRRRARARRPSARRWRRAGTRRARRCAPSRRSSSSERPFSSWRSTSVRRVLDGLVGADRAAEGEALLGVGDRHVERRLDAAERLGGDQRLRQIPGARERVLGRVEHRRGRVLQRDVAERAGRVVARHRLDRDARGAGLDRHADGLAVAAAPRRRAGRRPGASGTKAQLAADGGAAVAARRSPSVRRRASSPLAGSTRPALARGRRAG